MKNIALYCRVSTERQKDEKTVDSQISALVEYCKKNQFLIYDKYIDDGYSGSMLARPALDRLRDDAKAKKFDAVLMLAVDRLSRNYIHAGLVIEELKKSNIEVMFLNAPPTDTMEGRLMFNIQSAVGEYEKEKIKERTRRGRLFKARKGIIVGNIPPYGYRYVKNGDVGVYMINKEEAGIVREIYNLYVSRNLSMRGIVKHLYSKGIKPPKGGNKWGKSTISRILINESYTGITHYNKHLSFEPLETKNNEYRRVKNTGKKLRPKEEWISINVPPILEKDVYNKAQIKKTSNALHASRNTKHAYLLTGLIEHEPCGIKMGGNVSHDIAYYRCSERLKKFPEPKTCSGTIKSDFLDELIWDSLSNLITHPQPLLSYLKSKKGGTNKEVIKLNRELEEINKDLERIKYKEDGLAGEYSEGILNTDQVAILMNGLNLKRKLLTDKQYEKQLELEKVNMSAQAKPVDVKVFFKKLVNHIKNLSFEKKREVTRLVVSKIVLNKQKAVLNLNLESPYSFALPSNMKESGAIESMMSRYCGRKYTLPVLMEINLRTKEYFIHAD
jgi:site-specific DNA recombinase